MSLLVDLVALAVAFLVGAAIRRYLILTSGPQKTNLPFIKSYSFLTGSQDIIFASDKVLAVKAHDHHIELGDTFGCYFGENMQVFSRDPDLIYKILMSDFPKHRNRYYINSLSPYMKSSLLEARDDEWHSSRRAIGSVLKASKLKLDNVETDVDLSINEMMASIEKRLQTMDGDHVVDLFQINKNFFTQTILKIIYDTEDLISFDKEKNDVVEELHSFVNVNYEFIARVCFLIPSLAHLVRPLLGFFDHGKFLGMLTDKSDKILQRTLSTIEQRRKEGRLTTIHSLINSYRKGELSREQLKGNGFFLLLAGYATSVDTMSALMWELTVNQDAQDKLRADLQQYGEKSTYLDQCMNETLRLYPSIMTNRDLGEDVYHKDFRLVKGSCFNVSLYSLHRDPKYWGPDADVWRPDRFEPSNRSKFHPSQFIPFGLGPRNCVGYNLAKLEIAKFAVKFFLKYKVLPCAETQKKIEMLTLGALPFALPVKGPIYVRLEPAYTA